MKIISTQAGQGSDEALAARFTSWAGENPYYLAISEETNEGRVRHFIDLDEQGWMSEKPELMRCASTWILIAKSAYDSYAGRAVLAMVVQDGQQPYYKIGRAHV